MFITIFNAFACGLCTVVAADSAREGRWGWTLCLGALAVINGLLAIHGVMTQ